MKRVTSIALAVLLALSLAACGNPTKGKKPVNYKTPASTSTKSPTAKPKTGTNTGNGGSVTKPKPPKPPKRK